MLDDVASTTQSLSAGGRDVPVRELRRCLLRGPRARQLRHDWWGGLHTLKRRHLIGATPLRSRVGTLLIGRYSLLRVHLTPPEYNRQGDCITGVSLNPVLYVKSCDLIGACVGVNPANWPERAIQGSDS